MPDYWPKHYCTHAPVSVLSVEFCSYGQRRIHHNELRDMAKHKAWYTVFSVKQKPMLVTLSSHIPTQTIVAYSGRPDLFVTW